MYERDHIHVYILYLSMYLHVVSTLYILPAQELPMSQNPEVFGMDDNVDISKELQETRELFDSILITQSQHSGSSSGKKVEDSLNEIATDILSKVWTVGG